MTLVVDVGTNAEIVLGNRDRLLAASSPTGPAFEGAQISRRPARRAGRDRARPDRPRDARAALPGHRRRRSGRTSPASRRRSPRPASPASAARGSSRSSPRCSSPASSPRTAIDRRRARRAHAARSSPTAGRSRYVLHDGSRRPARGSSITQNDVRAIQLAKAALYAGVRLLMDHARDRRGRRDPARRRVRQPDRPDPRDGPRPDPGLRPRPRPRRPATPPAPGALIALLSRRRAARDRGRRPAGREDRDRGRAALPGALRRGDGLPAQDGRRSRTSRAVVTLPARRRRRRAGGADAARPNDAGAAPVRDRQQGGPTDGRQPPRRRSGGRAARQALRARTPTPSTCPFLTRTLAPFEVLDEEGLVAHRAQRRHDPRGGRHRVPRRRRRAPAARATPAPTSRASGSASRAGCAARSSRRPRRAQFTQYARNPERNVEIGGMHTVFAPNYGSPFVRDLDNGRRYGTIEDFRNFVKLAYASAVPAPLAAARSASRSTCRSTSATSTWSMRTSATATSRSWARSPHPSGRATRSRWRGSCSARSTSRTTRSSCQPDQRQLAAGLGRDDARARRGPTPRPTRRRCMTPFILAGAMAPGDRRRRLRPDPRRGARPG